MLRTLLLGLLGICSTAAPAAAHAATPAFRMGFFDTRFMESDGAAWVERAKTAGAQTVRIGATWDAVAATRPANPTDPNDPAYSWAPLDRSVRNAAASGLDVLLSVGQAPAWAEGSRRPAGAARGSWRPNAAAFGSFGRAVAARYSGRWPGLPRVSAFQAWNEPNLESYLAPQWRRTGSGWQAESPRSYRALLNAFYAGVKAASPAAQVVTGGTAPFGDLQPGGNRIAPVRFVRSLLCLDAGGRSTACRARPRFDVLAHHPYSVRGPDARAYNSDDVSVADIGKLRRLLRAARAAGTTRGVRKRLWVTEIAWDSNPPDPHAIPERQQADWLAGAMRQLSRNGVDAAFWTFVGDQLPEPDYASTFQSGVYFSDGTPKLSARAFALPFVPRRKGRSVTLWALPRATGRLSFERAATAGWRPLKTVGVRSGRPVEARLPIRGASRLRARVGSQTSLVWRVGR